MRIIKEFEMVFSGREEERRIREGAEIEEEETVMEESEMDSSEWED